MSKIVDELNEFAVRLGKDGYPTHLIESSALRMAAMEGEIVRLQSDLDKYQEDVDWLRCLEVAGVDNWEGIEAAIDIRESGRY